ncbi:MAG: hypothetical protein JEZ14_24745 [Marinilabiliaceae bacterium]|nr:hypothetical protein [Marinilabiliaceae bacterium]
MKHKILNIALMFLLPVLLGAGCGKDELPPLEDKILKVTEMNASGCKDQLKSSDIERYVELKAENDNQLRVRFINASLNCCPGEITSNAFIQNEILKIVFMEETMACNCICDFDLECVIDSMENRSYEMEVYAHSEKPKAKFTFYYSKKLNARIKVSDN